MERKIDFKNFLVNKTKITGEMYCDGKYIMELGCNLAELSTESDTQVALYRYFRQAAITYLKVKATFPFDNNTIH